MTTELPYNFLAIEGNIGAGRTTLAHTLAEKYSAKLLLEEFEDNTFLPKFYSEPDRFAFPLELSFLADRYTQLKQHLVTQELFSNKIVSDYLLIKSLLFAKINLNFDEFNLFKKMFEIIELQVPQPELLIYLKSPIDQLQSQIKKRNRSFEQCIPDSYLEKVEAVYEDYLTHSQQKTLIVDAVRYDFLNNKNHLATLFDVLYTKQTARIQYLD